MDRQHREGGKTGSGHGLLTAADQAAHRRQRLMKLAMDTADLSGDPFVIRNHLGQWECVLCLTVHTNEGSYLAHCQAKRHQANLARRAAREAHQQPQASGGPGTVHPATGTPAARQIPAKAPRIGRPGFTVRKVKDSSTGQRGVLLHVHMPQIAAGRQPAFRLMSAFEQRLEAPNRAYLYALVAGDPYDTVAFKVPNRPVVQDPELFYSHWDQDFQVFTVQIVFEKE